MEHIGVVDSLSTRPSLLIRIRDSQDALAWNEFVGIYGPLVYWFGRRRGLQDADAADLTQEVLRAVSCAVAQFQYDPDRGGFRRWLFTVTRNELADFVGRAHRGPVGAGDTAMKKFLEQQPVVVDEARLWDEEYQQQILDWAAERVQSEVHESTWQAFWQTAVEGQRAEEVAKRLGMSVGAVYIAKSRVIARLREHVEQQEGQ
ncbi:MAG: RNA polymerase sigma factor [Thermoguttaceae bacterium]